jgi:AraC-like DNA-binding protein
MTVRQRYHQGTVVDMFRRGTVLRRWVVSFICFVGATITVVSAVLFAWYARESIRAFGELSLKELRQTASGMELLDQSIKATGFVLVQDTDIILGMSASTAFGQIEPAVHQTIINAMLANSMIESIYLVNKRANVIIGSPSAGSASVRDYHRRISALVQPQKENAIIRIDAHTIRPGPDAGTPSPSSSPLMSYVFFGWRMSGPDDSFLIINLRSNDVQKKIMDAESIRGHVILTANRAGQIVFAPQSGQPFSPKGFAEALARVPDGNVESGRVFDAAIGGRRNLVTWLRSDPLGYLFIALTPNNVVLRSATALRNWTILFGVLLFAVGVLISVALARRFYLPLGRLMQKYVGAGGRPSGDEFQVLDGLLETSSSRVTSLDEFVGRNLPLIQQDYLKRILDNRITLGAPATRERLRELGLDFPHDVFLVVILAPDRMADPRARAGSTESLRGKARTIADHLKAWPCVCEAVGDLDAGTVTVLLNYKAEAAEAIGRALRERCRILQEQILTETDGTLTVALGGPSITGFAESFALARGILDYRVKYGGAAILDAELVAEGVRGNDLFPQEEEKDLLESLRTLSEEKMRASLKRMFEEFRHYSSTDISRALLHVLYSSLQSISELIRAEGVMVGVDLFSIYGRISRCLSLSAMEVELGSFYKGTIDKLEGKIRQSGSSHAHLMKKVIDFVDQHFRDPGLSLEIVADHVGMNHTYLGKVFNESVGSHFTDYVNRKRIECARELLLQTTLTVSEVSLKAGFSSPSYFITYFRKQLGITPAAFRNGNT